MFKNYQFLTISLILKCIFNFSFQNILKKHGKNINNFKYVIRLNNSATKKYIKNVGLKTSLYFKWQFYQ